MPLRVLGPDPWKVVPVGGAYSKDASVQEHLHCFVNDLRVKTENHPFEFNTHRAYKSLSVFNHISECQLLDLGGAPVSGSFCLLSSGRWASLQFAVGLKGEVTFFRSHSPPIWRRGGTSMPGSAGVLHSGCTGSHGRGF